MDLLPARWRHTIRRFSCVLLTGGVLALGEAVCTPEAHAQFLGQNFGGTAEGAMTTATGYASGFNALSNVGANATAVGNSSTATGLKSTSIGWSSTASGEDSNAFGRSSQATNLGANAFGAASIASGDRSTAIGDGSSATGDRSTAFGAGSAASKDYATALGANSTASGLKSTSIGWSSTASGDDSNAFGRSSQATNLGANAFGAASIASGGRSTAIGDGSSATGDRSTAFGAGSSAGFLSSTAIGSGAATTRDNQMVFGTSTNTYTASGINSAASLAAQTGPTRFVTSDAAGNLATSDLNSAVANSAAFQNLRSDIRNNTEGVAMAIALGGSGSILPENKSFAVSTNFGTFQGQNAMGFSGVGRLNDNVFLNGGVGAGLGQGTVGGRAGITFAW